MSSLLQNCIFVFSMNLKKQIALSLPKWIKCFQVLVGNVVGFVKSYKKKEGRFYFGSSFFFEDLFTRSKNNLYLECGSLCVKKTNSKDCISAILWSQSYLVIADLCGNYICSYTVWAWRTSTPGHTEISCCSSKKKTYDLIPVEPETKKAESEKAEPLEGDTSAYKMSFFYVVSLKAGVLTSMKY